MGPWGGAGRYHVGTLLNENYGFVDRGDEPGSLRRNLRGGAFGIWDTQVFLIPGLPSQPRRSLEIPRDLAFSGKRCGGSSASGLVPPFSEPFLTLSAGLKERAMHGGYSSGERLEEQAAMVSWDEFKTPCSCPGNNWPQGCA